MAKKTVNKALKIAEALVFGVFIFSAYLGAAAIAKPELFTDVVTHGIAIVLAAYATLVFGFVLVKSIGD